MMVVRLLASGCILLGGKSVNGMPIVFPYDGAVPYHVYWKVLNAKDFGVPQNRERVFIIGIRDDVDNDFSFPKEVPLTKRLKDVLESEVDEKYYLSDKMIAGYFKKRENTSDGSGFGFRPKEDGIFRIALQQGIISSRHQMCM
jgi:DNA (cytosine-5)-methyltransferase 1